MDQYRANSDSLTLDERVALVLAEWARDTPRLLIFDNCEDPALLRAYRPRGGGCRVLATSRNAVWPPTLGAATLALDVLPAEESVALLRALCARINAEEATQVAEALGRLPLALQLAGSYLERYSTPVERYLEALASPALLEHASLTGRGVADRPTGREMHVAKAFALSFEKLDTANLIDAAALALLARATWLVPGEPFPQALLEAALVVPEADEAAALNRSDGLRRLLELGLLERAGGDGLKLHRLLARYAGQAAQDDGAQAAIEDVLFYTASELNRAGFPQQLAPIQVQLRHVTDVARERDDERAARLCLNLGYLLQEQGDYAGARPYYERALAISEQALGPQHPNTAQSLNNLGGLLQAQGDYAEARPSYERALAISEQALGPQHPDTASSLNNLGALLQAQGDYAGARPYYERALAILEQALGPQHPNTAQSLNNLGALLQAQGDYAGARPYYERALAIREQALGPQHPDTAQSLNSLGGLLDSMGDYAEARPHYERALAIREQALGPQHPDTAQSLNNLGGLLDRMGDYAEARPYYERALAILEQALGPQHPDTAGSLNNLGGLLDSMGDYAGARPYYERALAILEQALGPQHPDTAGSLNNLGGLLQAQGDYAEARPYYERALAIHEQALGPQHPNTAGSLNNLAILCYYEDEIAEAARLMRRALAILEHALGPQHPNSVRSRESLAVIEGKLGLGDGARTQGGKRSWLARLLGR